MISLDAMPIPLKGSDQFSWVDPVDWEAALRIEWRPKDTCACCGRHGPVAQLRRGDGFYCAGCLSNGLASIVERVGS